MQQKHERIEFRDRPVAHASRSGVARQKAAQQQESVDPERGICDDLQEKVFLEVEDVVEVCWEISSLNAVQINILLLTTRCSCFCVDVKDDDEEDADDTEAVETIDRFFAAFAIK